MLAEFPASNKMSNVSFLQLEHISYNVISLESIIQINWKKKEKRKMDRLTEIERKWVKQSPDLLFLLKLWTCKWELCLFIQIVSLTLSLGLHADPSEKLIPISLSVLYTMRHSVSRLGPRDTSARCSELSATVNSTLWRYAGSRFVPKTESLSVKCMWRFSFIPGH